MTTTITETTVLHSYQTEFETRDQKGRQIGALAVVERLVYEAVDRPWGFTREPGTYFTSFVQATRNGSTFGASQRAKFFASEEAALQDAALRVAACRKRYAKQFAA